MLKGRIAVVAGATRGAGRGIAAGLGEAGATVYCTGRSSRSGTLKSDYAGRPETIEETAELVTSLGGEGIAVAVDHLDPVQVRALADRVRSERGGLDILVNDIWGAEQIKGGPAAWNRPLWELDLDAGLRLLALAVETHLITSHALLGLMAGRDGLLVEVTDGPNEYNAANYRISVFYDLAKTCVNRLAFSQGHELAAHGGGTAVAVTPGFLRSEMMLEAFGVTEANWREAEAPAHWDESESPRYVGRGIAALAADPGKQRFNQQSLTSGQLMREYGVTDLDGSQPDVWASILAS